MKRNKLTRSDEIQISFGACLPYEPNEHSKYPIITCPHPGDLIQLCDGAEFYPSLSTHRFHNIFSSSPWIYSGYSKSGLGICILIGFICLDHKQIKLPRDDYCAIVSSPNIGIINVTFFDIAELFEYVVGSRS